MLRRVAVCGVLGLCYGSDAVAQTVNSWYPDYSTLYHVKSCWYDLRSFNGAARVGVSFVETPGTFFFYFTPSDAAQLQKASAIYASLLAAQTNGINVYVFISAGDTVTGGWDFISIQVGPN